MSEKTQIRIHKAGLFHTPSSMEEIDNWIERHAPEERIHLYTAAYMMYNWFASLIEDESVELTVAKPEQENAA